MIRVEFCIFWKKTTELKSHFHHIISRVHTINMGYHCWCYLDHLAEIVFVRFPHCKVTFSPLSMLSFLKGGHYAQSTLKENIQEFCWIFGSLKSARMRVHHRNQQTLFGELGISTPLDMWLGLSFTRWWTGRWGGIWMKGLTVWKWRRFGGRRGAVLLRHRLGLKKFGTDIQPPDNPTETITQRVLTSTRLGPWWTYLCVCLFTVVMITIGWVPPLYKVFSKNTTSKQQRWDLHFLCNSKARFHQPRSSLFQLLPPSLSIGLLIRSVSRWWDGDWWWVSKSWLVVGVCCQLLFRTFCLSSCSWKCMRAETGTSL